MEVWLSINNPLFFMVQNKLKRVGNTDSLGNTDRVGKTDRVGSLDLGFKKIRGRREFFDLIKKYIGENSGVNELKLNAYFQYTTGATDTSIKQALAVLESLDLIKCIENSDPPFERIYNKK